jgi:hypothetical protein
MLISEEDGDQLSASGCGRSASTERVSIGVATG